MLAGIRYSSRFQDPAAVAAYESQEYGAGSYASMVWQWQRPVLEQIIREFRAQHPAPVRLLDFACGTGRVLAALEPLVDQAEGVDISENMVALARPKCPRARIQVGDLLAQPGLLQPPFALITVFRFLLNVEPALRQGVLSQLRELIQEPDGWLLVNVHGNSRSLRHPAIVWRRWRAAAQPACTMLNEMSVAETKDLLHTSGFEIVRQFGFGILPPTLYRTPLRRPAAAVDKLLAGDNRWRNCSIDLMFVCRPARRC